uniref:UBA_e1_C domain-containing protein n=1 Tax=Macrostomum lignano TaxID=282301 RepID=A0A1I8FRU0_9PLAT
MLKYIRHRPKPSAQPVRDANEQLSGYRNCFLNLAVPLLVLSEPGPCRKQPLPGGRNFTEWDRWEVGPLSRSATIAQLTQQVQQRYGLTPSMVCQGSKSVYIPMLPGHRKRLQQTYVDLTVMYEPDASICRGDAATDDDIETDIVGPIVRVHLSDE